MFWFEHIRIRKAAIKAGAATAGRVQDTLSGQPGHCQQASSVKGRSSAVA